MTTTLPSRLKKIADEVASAHKTVLDLQNQHKRCAHRRNLGALVLVRTHKRKVVPTLRVAGLARNNWVTGILPKAPTRLPDWTAEKAEEVLAETVKTIADLAIEEARVREVRIRGLRALADAELDGEPLFTNTEIADLVGMSKVTVGEDLAKTAEAAAAADDSTLEPAAVLAEKLGVPLKELMDRIQYARENGIAVPRTSRGSGRVLMVDVPAFEEWWTANRFHWLPAQALAERWGVEYGTLKERLRAAKAKGTTPESENRGRRIFYNPEAADAWGTQYGYAPAGKS
ncbi:hypothetical protein [Planomonospora sp. ID82291]|uniref:hypothetical protein n=1 Tax=Planomonospora sp. ID82291 TaxID=2738136 RepID=UPI0018C3C2F7|nr:hypothetical protein [Planomonospora sp. ID82291]MBG0818966.1 hypothetical protein [Planomonospora sp. ID82291]